MNNNFFKYADKELLIDTFFCWLINEMQGNPEMEDLKQAFVHELLGFKKRISSDFHFEAQKQVKNADLVIYCDEEKSEILIFENKLHSTVHSDQLNRYVEELSNYEIIGKYYLKLGYVHLKDKIDADEAKYTIIDVDKVLKFLKPFKDRNRFIAEFYDYMHSDLAGQNEIMERWFNSQDPSTGRSDNEKYGHHSFQQYVIEKLFNHLKKEGFKEDLFFKIGNNPDGSPWTQVDFSRVEKVYDEISEYLFFRMDKRSGKYYLRINLYSTQGKEYWIQKAPRLNALRDHVESRNNQYEINFGRYHNQAKNETEVAIMFFKDNPDIEKLLSESAKLAKELYIKHQDMS